MDFGFPGDFFFPRHSSPGAFHSPYYRPYGDDDSSEYYSQHARRPSQHSSRYVHPTRAPMWGEIEDPFDSSRSAYRTQQQRRAEEMRQREAARRQEELRKEEAQRQAHALALQQAQQCSRNDDLYARQEYEAQKRMQLLQQRYQQGYLTRGQYPQLLQQLVQQQQMQQKKLQQQQEQQQMQQKKLQQQQEQQQAQTELRSKPQQLAAHLAAAYKARQQKHQQQEELDKHSNNSNGADSASGSLSPLYDSSNTASEWDSDSDTDCRSTESSGDSMPELEPLFEPASPPRGVAVFPTISPKNPVPAPAAPAAPAVAPVTSSSGVDTAPISGQGQGLGFIDLDSVVAPVTSSSGVKMSEKDAAVAIQAAWRGCQVRGGRPLEVVKPILELRKQVREMEERLGDKEFVAKVVAEPLEKLRVSETVMCWLLRLDEVQSSNQEVRAVRRDMARKLNRLLDRVDALVLPPIKTDDGETEPTKGFEPLDTRKNDELLDPVDALTPPPIQTDNDPTNDSDEGDGQDASQDEGSCPDNATMMTARVEVKSSAEDCPSGAAVEDGGDDGALDGVQDGREDSSCVNDNDAAESGADAGAGKLEGGDALVHEDLTRVVAAGDRAVKRRKRRNWWNGRQKN